MNFLKKHIDPDALKYSLAFAVIYCLMFNSSIFYYKFTHYSVGTLQVIFIIIRDFFLTTLALSVFFFGLTLHNLLFRISSVILFFFGSFASYHMFVYGKYLSNGLLTSIYGNSPLEMYKFVSIKLTIWAIFSVGICCSAIWHFRISTPAPFFTKLLSALCLFLFINCIISPPFDFIENYYPIRFLNSTYEYFVY